MEFLWESPLIFKARTVCISKQTKLKIVKIIISIHVIMIICFINFQGGSAAVNIDDDSVKRYSNQYEQGIDPFALFSRKVCQICYTLLTSYECLFELKVE